MKPRLNKNTCGAGQLGCRADAAHHNGGVLLLHEGRGAAGGLRGAPVVRAPLRAAPPEPPWLQPEGPHRATAPGSTSLASLGAEPRAQAADAPSGDTLQLDTTTATTEV